MQIPILSIERRIRSRCALRHPAEQIRPASTTNIGSYQTPETHSSPVPGPRPTGNSGSVPGSGRLVVESSVSGARITLNGESDPEVDNPAAFLFGSRNLPGFCFQAGV